MEYLLSFKMKKKNDKDVPCVVFNYRNGKGIEILRRI